MILFDRVSGGAVGHSPDRRTEARVILQRGKHAAPRQVRQQSGTLAGVRIGVAFRPVRRAGVGDAVDERRTVNRLGRAPVVGDGIVRHPFDLLQRGVDAVESDLGERIMQLLHEPPSHIVLPAIAVRREEVGALFEKVWHTEPGNSDPTYLTHQARIHLRSKFLGADIAMTGVNFAVAEAGAFAVCTNEGNADLGTSFPDLHIAIMGLEKVIPDYRALAVFTRLLARSATGQPVTAYTSLYRRPAPGKQIHVIIVDNGRTESLANAAHRNMLKCLRCGACMNTCPVYRRSGGYSYSYFIPGPLGINLGMLRSPERYGGNVSGCSLCYSCSDVCPAKIDLGEQIYAWRQEMGEKNLIDWHKKFMVKGMDFAMGGPGRFYAAVGAARIAEYLPRFVLNNKLNPWYAYGRDMPHFARSTFNARWKAGKVKSEKPTER